MPSELYIQQLRTRGWGIEKAGGSEGKNESATKKPGERYWRLGVGENGMWGEMQGNERERVRRGMEVVFPGASGGEKQSGR